MTPINPSSLAADEHNNEDSTPAVESYNGQQIASDSDYSAKQPDDTGVLPPDVEFYPSTLTPADTYRVLKNEGPEPVIDRALIIAVAAAYAPDGKQSMIRHHDALFHVSCGLQLTALEEQERARIVRVASRKLEANDLTRQLRRTDRYHTEPVPHGSTPWTWHDRAEAGLLMAASVAALVIGVTNSTNLLSSTGEPSFNEWWKALPLAFGIVIGAIGFKAVGRLLPSGPLQRAYGMGLFFVGLVSFTAWLFDFSAIFSKALVPAAERIAALGSLDGGGDAAASSSTHASHWMVFFGIAADAALSAGAWLVVGFICQAHVLSRRVENPSWTAVRKHLNRVHKHLHEEESLLGLVRGALTRLRATRAAFIEKSIALYGTATAQATAFKDALNG